MPIDFIDTSQSSLLYQPMRQFQSHMKDGRDIGKWLSGKFNHGAADPDYSGIETMLGLSAGEGVVVYNLFVAAYARINHADVEALLDRVISP